MASISISDPHRFRVAATRILPLRSICFGLTLMFTWIVDGATRSWTGAAGDGSWTTPGNWTDNAVPGPLDDAVVPAGTPKIRLAGATVAVGNLSCAAALEMEGASLSVSKGSSIVSAGLTLHFATLTARTTGASLTVNGPATAVSSSLFALEGASLALPGLAHVDGGSTAGSYFLRADGVGSRLLLTGVTNIAGITAGFSTFEISAIRGGTVELDRVERLTTGGYASLLADGAESTLNLAALTQLLGCSLEARNRGQILCTDLAEAQYSTLIERDNASLPSESLRTLLGVSIFVSGGASMQFPRLETYETGNLPGNWSLEARDTDSELGFSGLTRFIGALAGFSAVEVRAVRGGTIRAPGLTTLGEGFGRFISDGAASTLDLSNLANLTGGELLAQNNGKILCPHLTSLTDTSVFKEGSTSVLASDKITSVLRSSIRASGGAVMRFPLLTSYETGDRPGTWTLEASGADTILDFPKLTRLVGALAGFSALETRASRGGRLNLPLPIRFGDGFCRLAADGQDSLLDLSGMQQLQGWELQVTAGGRVVCPGLTEVADSLLRVVGDGSILHTAGIQKVRATSCFVSGGGVLRFPALTLYETGSRPGTWTLEAADASSVLDFPVLTRLVGALAGFSALDARALRGGKLIFQLPTTLGEGFCRLLADGDGSILDISGLERLGAWELAATGGGRVACPNLLEANGATLSLGGSKSVIPTAKIQKLTASSCIVNGGGVLSFPALNRYDTGAGSGSWRMDVADPGSVLEFPSATQFAGALAPFSGLSIRASRGGTFRLPMPVSLGVGAAILSAEGSGSTVELPNLRRLLGWQLGAVASARVIAPHLEELSGCSLVLDGVASVLPTSEVRIATGTSLTVARGATLSFPALARFDTGETSAQWNVSGAGSVLDLPILTDLSGARRQFSNLGILVSGGGAALLPSVRALDVGVYLFRISGDGSRIHLSSVTSATNLDAELQSGGQLDLSRATRLRQSQLRVVGTTASATTDQLASITDSLITLDGARLSFTGLQDTRGTTFQTPNGGQAILPPAADLQVTDIVAPAAALGGAPVTFVWEVTNESANPTSGTRHDGFALRRDGSPDVTFGTIHVDNALSANERRRYTNTVIIPTGLTGIWRFVVSADAAFEVYEGNNEGNNVRVDDVTIGLSSPDLVVLEVKPEVASAQLGQNLVVSWVVKNQGSTNASTAWEDLVLLSTNQTDFSAAVPLASFPRPSALGTNGTYTNRQSVALPLNPDLTKGTYFLGVLADSRDALFESNEANNAATTTLSLELPPLPNLVAVPVSVPAVAAPGENFEIVYDIRNLGAPPAIGPWEESIQLSRKSISAPGEPAAFIEVARFTNPGPRPSGTVERLTQGMFLPPGLAPGAWFVQIVVDAGDAVVESDESNTFEFDHPLIVPPTLALSVPQSMVREDAIPPTLLARVSRNGETVDPLSVALLNSHPKLLNLPANVIIPAGQEGASFPFTILRDNLSLGDVSVEVNAVAEGQRSATARVTVVDADVRQLTIRFERTSVIEGSSVQAVVTRNALMEEPLSVHFATDSPNRFLAPEKVTIPAGKTNVNVGFTALDDDLISPAQNFTVTAGASGFAEATAGIEVLDNDLPVITLTLSRTTVSEGDGAFAATATVRRFGAVRIPLLVRLTSTNTNAAVVPFTLSIPAGEEAATFSLAAVDDSVTDGSQETLIVAQCTETTTGEPAGLAVSQPLTVTDDDGPTLKVKLARRFVGEGLTPATTATLSNLSAKPVVATVENSDSTEAIVSPTSISIPAGGTAEIAIHSLADGVPDGNQTVVITARATGYAPGSDTLIVSDLSLPEFVVDEITAPTQGVTRSLASIGWKVLNQGLATAKGRLKQTVYLSADNRLDADDSVVAEQELDGELPPGQSFGFVRSIFLPAEPGDYWVFVRTDSDNAFVEALEDNNLGIGGTPIRVLPAYVADAVTVSPSITGAGQPVQISGRLRRSDTGEPAAFEVVAVQILSERAGGLVKRVVGGLSDAGGFFKATFRPGADETGVFGVAAGHPEVEALPQTHSFVLLGFGVEGSGLVSWTLEPGRILQKQLSITALGPQAQTGLKAAFIDLPAGFVGTAEMTPGTLLPNSPGTVRYELSAPPNLAGRFSFALRLTSAEGALLDIPFELDVRPPLPILTVTPDHLVSGMVLGRQSSVPVAVTNTGNSPTGPLTIALPEASWLSTATPLPLPSLAPGEGTVIQLLLTPGADMLLQLYTGEFGVIAEAATTRVPFTFRAVSKAVGDLEIETEDEYTYYAVGAPKVAGAHAQLLDPYDHSRVLREATTDAFGFRALTGIAEGSYVLRVTAPKHATRELRILIQPGVTTRTRVLLPTETVAYSWAVVPTEIPDRYQVTLESKFEANVPFPVVTTLEPVVFPVVYPGEITQLSITYTNHGLIAAKGLKLQPRSTKSYLITPLFTDLGDLPAKSSITVPVFVQLQPDVDAQAIARLKELGRWPPPGGVGAPGSAPTAAASLRQVGLHAGGDGSGGDDCEQPELDVVYFVICGSDGIYHTVRVDLKPLMMLKDAYGCAKALAGLTKGVAGVPGAICDCASTVASAMGAAVPGSVECVCAFLSLDAAGIAKCICPKIVGDGGGAYEGGGGIFAFTGVPSGPGGDSDCSPAVGAAAGGNSSLALTATRGGFAVASSLTLAKSTTANNPSRHAAKADGNPFNPIQTLAADGICATVKLRIEQDLVLTRAAFRGTLGLENRQSNPLTDVSFRIDFFDASGRPANELFGVRPPVLQGLTAVNGNGILPANTLGAAEFTIVPGVDSAPTGETPYTVGGELRYRDGAQEVVITLQPVALRVLPQPRLTVDYFHQRNVLGDDPHTPEIEPSEPFTLAAMLRNVGAGTAKAIRITSGQPKIVENEKDLLIDFEIIGTERYGGDGHTELTPALTADFGDLASGEVKIGRWLFKSSLQGFFKDYTAIFEHIDGLGQRNLSLIDPDGVLIHELTHLVHDPRAGSDALPDFLVNQDYFTDPGDLPDTLYLSTGAIEPVVVVREAQSDHPVGPEALRIELTFAAVPGWTYARIPDPQGFTDPRRFRLIRVVRSDGPSLPSDNFWQTDRTFIGLGRRPIQENLLHLFDHDSTGRYTLVYEAVAPADTTPPSSQVAGLPPQVTDQFPVHWSGADLEGGTLKFDVYVSQDNGVFIPWLKDTGLPGAIYPGEHGHAYAFYSVATDAAGNREAAPASPDASTRTLLENTAPTLGSIPDTAIDEGEEFTWQLETVDPDVPAQTLVYLLGPGAPAGLTLDATTGLLRWPTGEGNGPSTNLITVFVRDNGSPSLTDSKSFRLQVREVNSAPLLAPIAEKAIKEGRLLTFVAQAVDTDLPLQRLTYSLAPGAPIGATMDSDSGVFSWRPREFQGPSTNVLTIVVQDSASPPRSASATFRVLVRDALEDFRLAIGSTNVSAGQPQSVPIRLFTGTPLTRLDFRLESMGRSLSNLRVFPMTPTLESIVFRPLGAGAYGTTFFSTAGETLDGEMELAHLAFDTAADHSEVAPLVPLELTAIGETEGATLRGRGSGGRVFVVKEQPLLDASQVPRLTIYGLPGRTYRIESTATADGTAPWESIQQLRLVTPSIDFVVPASDETRFLRALEVPVP